MATNTMASTGGLAASPAKNRCVAVVGMHRSGTSATAGLLVSLGLTGPKPDDLQPATGGNERGHFESKQMGVLNSRLLHAVGGTWTASAPGDPSWDGIRKHARATRMARSAGSPRLTPDGR